MTTKRDLKRRSDQSAILYQASFILAALAKPELQREVERLADEVREGRLVPNFNEGADHVQ